MSGIVGWVEFDRDLGAETGTVRRMADALAHRGPDGGGEWAGGHAALGHRRLALLDVEGGTQPVTVEIGGTTAAVLVLDGAVTNHRELRRELARTGPFRRGDDAEVALRAYLEWGTGFVERLEGMFALAVWDVREQRLLLARDRLGVKPLTYARTPHGILFGSEPKAVLAHPAMAAEVDATGLRELFAHGKMPGTTVFRGVDELRPGHVIVQRREGLTQQRYWTLPAREHTDDLATTVDTVRSLLAAAVESHLDADVEVACMLSGGIDSSALTALAKQRAGGLATFSLNFAGYAENFEPHPTMRATPDAPFASMVAEHVGTRHTEILLDTEALSDLSAHERAMWSQDMPSPLGDMDVSLVLFFAALKKHGVSAVLSGETADELFNGYFWAYDPAHSNAHTFPWVSFERGHDAAAGGLGCSLIDRSLRKELDFLGYADQHYRDALREVPQLAGETAQEARAREITYLALTRWAPTHLDRADRLSMSAGVQLRAPFCDRALIEYVFNVPAAMKRVNGQEKSLLRTAVADLLPQAVLDRRKSAYPTTQEVRYGEFVRSRFVELMADGSAQVTPLLDIEATRAALQPGDAVGGAFAWVERASMEMVLQLENWLTQCDVKLRL